MKKIAMVNHKGGTGKTTSALNVGAGLSLKGKKVLLVDIDSQANLSQGLGIHQPDESINDALVRKTDLPIVKLSENLSLVPSTLALQGAELNLVNQIGREMILKELLEEVEQNYDYCIIDCPPNLGILTLNGLVASDYVFVPLEAEYYAFNGLDNIIEMISKVKKHYNENLQVGGVFITQCNNQRKITERIVSDVQEIYGDKALKTRLRVDVSAVEASMKGVSVFEYAPESNITQDYKSLIEEIISQTK